MTVWMILLILFGVAVVIFLVIGYRAPSQRNVQAQISVQMDSQALFAFLITMKNWQQWRLMPEMTVGKEVRFSGPDQGTGALMMWEPKKENGSIALGAILPSERIDYTFSFGKKAGMIACYLELIPNENGTTIRSHAILEGGNIPASKIMISLFEPTIRRDLETSLARLRTILSGAI